MDNLRNRILGTDISNKPKFDSLKLQIEEGTLTDIKQRVVLERQNQPLTFNKSNLALEVALSIRWQVEGIISKDSVYQQPTQQ